MRRSTTIAITWAAVLAAAAVSVPAPAGAGARSPGSTLVELRPEARCREAAYIVQAGGTIVAPSLGLYRLSDADAETVVPALAARGSLLLATPNRLVGTLAASDFGDPLVPTEWWRATIGVAGLTPPPPGRPVTIVDSGIDVSHPDYLGRANTETLNAQEPAPIGGEHGTAVGSIIAAPVNGVGLVGIYPEAVLRSWDAALGGGTMLETGQIVQGILAAANAGPGVINLSLFGENEVVVQQAINQAVRKGSLIVAASGNEGGAGSPLGYPASYNHVLTVAATDRQNRVTAFSSRSPFVDLAAPGVGIPIATTVDNGWHVGDGTSYAAPLVSGASAWVWTARPELDATQLFEVMRRSAVDIEAPGRDDASGFGLLDVPAALSYPVPIRDPLEPNDDIDFVRPGGLYDNGIPPLTSPTRARNTVNARLDLTEDPSDVYRVWLPKNGRMTATLGSTANVDLTLWSQGTLKIGGQVNRNRLAATARPGPTEELSFLNRGAGRYAYLAVTCGPDVREATYRLRLFGSSYVLRSSVDTAAKSTGGSRVTSGFRTRTRTALTGQPSRSASASAAAKLSSSWYALASETSLTRATTSR